MASTYSSLKIELIGTGEQSGTWGITTNTNLGTAIEEAITGSADVAFSSADVTLSLTNTNASQTARNLRLNLTGTSGGARNLTVPDIEKYYIITNGLADAVTVKNSTGSTYTIPAGSTAQIFSTGLGVVNAISYLVGTAVLTGGSLNNSPIGATTPNTGAFTTLNSTGGALNGTVGATTPAAGTFTTLNSTGGALNGTVGATTPYAGTFTSVATPTISSSTQIVTFNTTGAITLPNGTSGQQPGSPTAGMIRYNTTTGGFEGYTTTWGAIGGGASAGGAIYENKNTITSNYTLTTNYNGMSVSPLTISSGVTVTVPSGQRWVIL